MKNLFSKLKGKKGFTLVEMIVVMAIIGILVALLAPNVATLIKDAQDTSNDAKTKNVMTTLAAYNTKHVKDGYTFVTGSAGAENNLDENDAVKEYVLKVNKSNFASAIPALWTSGAIVAGTTPTPSKVSYIGGSDAYLPENVLTGNDEMYLYLSSEGTVMGVAYVNNGKVKSVAGGLKVGAPSKIAITGGSSGSTVWSNSLLRGATTTNGLTFDLPTVPTTTTPPAGGGGTP